MPNNRTDNIIIFVLNPISGDKDKSHLEEEIKQLAHENQVDLKTYKTTGNNDEEEIRLLVDKFSPSRIIVAGGDGTVGLVGKLLLNSNISLGIIPLGSANGLATELKIPLNSQKALQIAFSGEEQKIDALAINEEFIAFHLCDIGLNARIIKRFEKEKTRGFLGYTKSFFKEALAVKPLKFRLKIDDKEFLKKAYMVVMANATMYGTGVVVNPEGKIDDGQFEVIVFRPYSFYHILEMVVPFLTRKIHLLDYVDYYKCKKITIDNFKNKNLQVDGEIVGSPGNVNVRILPKALSVMVPALED